MTNSKQDVREFIRKNFAEVALKGLEGGCCGSGCSCSGTSMDISETALKIGYNIEAVKSPSKKGNNSCCSSTDSNSMMDEKEEC